MPTKNCSSDCPKKGPMQTHGELVGSVRCRVVTFYIGQVARVWSRDIQTARHVYVYVYVYVYVWVYVYVCVCVRRCVCMCVCMYVLCVCMCMCI